MLVNIPYMEHMGYMNIWYDMTLLRLYDTLDFWRCLMLKRPQIFWENPGLYRNTSADRTLRVRLGFTQFATTLHLSHPFFFTPTRTRFVSSELMYQFCRIFCRWNPFKEKSYKSQSRQAASAIGRGWIGKTLTLEHVFFKSNKHNDSNKNKS